jgi:Protein of unknown function (DUF3131)
MTFWRGLLAGRSHLAVLAGLGAAAVVAGAVHRFVPSGPERDVFEALSPPAAHFPLRPPGPLDTREDMLARTAWSFFEHNTDPRTGLAPAVRGHPAATLWDMGAHLMAILSAEDLGLVSAGEASARLGRALSSLARLPLCDGILPNKVYDTRTLEMVRYDGAPAPRGIGWSALDVARILAPLSIVAWRHPEHAPRIRAAVSRWRIEELADGATLRGASRGAGGALVRHREGSFGYEQHAAKALLRWGVPAAEALDYRSHLAVSEVGGQAVPRDGRRGAEAGSGAALVAEPWLLDALEEGLDAVTLPVARAVLRAQERRAATVRHPVAVSEDALDRAPWFSYSALVDAAGTSWASLAPGGARAPGALTFSTKAAVAWGVLFQGSYPERLLEAAAELAVPGEGLLAGRYDATWEPNRVLALNTNAVALEALAYRARGPAARSIAAPPATEARP